MKKIMFAMLLASSIQLSYGSTIQTETLRGAGWDQLSETQKADIIKQVEASAKSSNIANPTSQNVESWITVVNSIGPAIAKTVGETAKELNMAVNDFAASPIGKMTVMIILFKVFGGLAIHIFGSLLFLSVGLFSIIYGFKKFVSNDQIKNDRDGTFAGAYLFASLIIVILSMVILFTY